MSFEQASIERNEALYELAISKEPAIEFAAKEMALFNFVNDEEAVYMLALAVDHPEWKTQILEQIRKYKPHIAEPENALRRLAELCEHTERIEDAEDGSDWWQANLEGVRLRINILIQYFNPENSDVHKVLIVPSDTILPVSGSGRSFHLPDVSVILSHSADLDNFDHEFLHGIINPITEELAARISNDRVIELSQGSLKEKEMYGNNAISLLNEELIRTYNDVVKKGAKLITAEEFERSVQDLSEENFQKILKIEPRTKDRLYTMGISSLAEFQVRAGEYFEKYKKSVLRERIFNFYKDYEKRKEAQPDISFKGFLSENLEALFA